MPYSSFSVIGKFLLELFFKLKFKIIYSLKKLIVGIIYRQFTKLETCFSFLIHCWPIKAHEYETTKITKKIQKCNFSDFTRDFFNYFYTE